MHAARLASVPVLMLFATLVLHAQSDDITTVEAKFHIGEKATVCGRVVSARYAETAKGGSTFLDLDGRYPRQPFTIVILGESAQQFATTESKYRDKNICVTSKITQNGGAPEAVLTNSAEIQAEQANAVGDGQASLPPLQPAHPAASTPPPAAQSQAQAQPASPLPGSEPMRSLNPAESLIERSRQATFEFSEKLPHFICVEYMSRFSQQGTGHETPLDVISAELIYNEAGESYRNVKVDDRPTDKSLQEIGGSWSMGEFASTLLDLFDPRTDAQFRSVGPSTISGINAQLYDFEVRRENSHWMVQSRSATLDPAYGGSVWVDPKTARVLRIESQARNIPPDFPMDTVESAVDYSYVMIAGQSFLLPVHAESLGCERGSSYCSHNVIDFRNYHEFTVDSRILSPSK